MPDTTRIDELLSVWEAEHRNGREPDLAELCGNDAYLESAIRDRIAALKAFETNSTSNSDGAPLPSVLRLSAVFRLIAPYARGGLGVISRAKDETLDREIAIKSLLGFPTADRVRRFVREAAITGKLEHPGIVPIFAVQPGERPWFAMRFVHGRTLADAIREHHTSPTPTRLRKLLQQFVQVCNTIAYAHSRNVIHRDIKPANIMLGEFGETLVLDWGLAKEQHEEETPVPGELKSTSDFLTLDGSALGTPAFMSPEQAEGRTTDVSTASDIYTLGATLLAILTGKPPVSGNDLPTILAKVRSGSIEPKSGIPALDAVARTAMHRTPELRYRNALALAADVDAWLADEPVSVYREPWMVRCNRWARRHRAALRIAAAVLIVATVCSSLAAVFLKRSADRERGMKDQAEANFQMTRQAIDDYFVTVSQSRLGALPGGQELRKELLQKALAYYMAFLKARRDDGSREALAATYSKIAMIYGELGDFEKTKSSHTQAISLWQELAAAQPSNREFLRQLAGACDLAGIHALARGDNTQAEDLGQRSCKLLSGMYQAEPDDDRIAGFYSRALVNFATTLGRIGKPAEALDRNREGIDIDDRMLSRNSTDVLARINLAKKRNNLGVDLIDLNRFEESLTEFREAQRQLQTALQQLEDRKPHELFTDTLSNPLSQQAETQLNLGYALLLLNRVEDSVAALQEGLKTFAHLRASDPAVVRYQYSEWFGRSHLLFAQSQALKAPPDLLENGKSTVEAMNPKTVFDWHALARAAYSSSLRRAGHIQEADRQLSVVRLLLKDDRWKNPQYKQSQALVQLAIGERTAALKLWPECPLILASAR